MFWKQLKTIKINPAHALKPLHTYKGWWFEYEQCTSKLVMFAVAANSIEYTTTNTTIAEFFTAEMSIGNKSPGEIWPLLLLLLQLTNTTAIVLYVTIIWFKETPQNSLPHSLSYLLFCTLGSLLAKKCGYGFQCDWITFLLSWWNSLDFTKKVS